MLCEDERYSVVMMFRGCARDGDGRASGRDVPQKLRFVATEGWRFGMRSIGHVGLVFIAQYILGRAVAVHLCNFLHRETMRECFRSRSASEDALGI